MIQADDPDRQQAAARHGVSGNYIHIIHDSVSTGSLLSVERKMIVDEAATRVVVVVVSEKAFFMFGEVRWTQIFCVYIITTIKTMCRSIFIWESKTPDRL